MSHPPLIDLFHVGLLHNNIKRYTHGGANSETYKGHTKGHTVGQTEWHTEEHTEGLAEGHMEDNNVIGWMLGPGSVAGLQLTEPIDRRCRARWVDRAVRSISFCCAFMKSCSSVKEVNKPSTHPYSHPFIQASIHPSMLSSDLSILLLTYRLIRLLAHFLSFWLGWASDHRSHKPTTTILQYGETYRGTCGGRQGRTLRETYGRTHGGTHEEKHGTWNQESK